MKNKRLRRIWRHFKYWLAKKMFSEEERKVLFNIRMGFYGYKEGDGYDKTGSCELFD